MSLPEKQWAQVAEQKSGPLSYKDTPVPRPGPDEILVKIRYSGVYHTDLHALRGDWPILVKMPFVRWLNGSCMACEFCKQSDESLCPDTSLSGYIVDGTFQRSCMAKAAHASNLPKNGPLDAVAPILCSGLTVYKDLKESGIRPDRRGEAIPASHRGSYVGNPQDGVEAVDFFAPGLIKAQFKTAPLKDLPCMFEMMKQGKITGCYVLDIPQYNRKERLRCSFRHWVFMHGIIPPFQFINIFSGTVAVIIDE
ncbi:alcohol dehydrogenase [Aspergillus tanneri]|uniref:Alcohol dehydrogenase n=1 Tax=Aspergillus tanneri TaxID=1220188 RepID=A0A5M9MJX1_9EURO|nr:alcohol dehydrogenase [Aspergillus tanneri]KAA8643107.1 alcohol dehydrogenase [Aspergillus tanneri]